MTPQQRLGWQFNWLIHRFVSDNPRYDLIFYVQTPFPAENLLSVHNLG